MAITNFFRQLTQSPLAKAMLIGILIFLLLIPIAKIDHLVWERTHRFQEVIEEITSKWGGAQSVQGPLLVVPIKTTVTAEPGEMLINYKQSEYLLITPNYLETNIQLSSETRYRGIYEVPLYHANTSLTGNFDLQAALTSLKDNQTPQWDDAWLAVIVGDTKALQSPLQIHWNDTSLPPIPSSRLAHQQGFHAGLSKALFHRDLVNKGKLTNGTNNQFTITFVANGSQGIYVTPLGKESVTQIKGDWLSPSFQGDWLPTHREITAGSFSANWNIPFLAKGQPPFWVSKVAAGLPSSSPVIGVTMPEFAGPYQTIERSVKYAVLFLVSTFTCLWLIELTAGIRIHPIQYLMTGLTLCLFYLLFLSLTEHIGVNAAYAIASLAVISQIGWYCHQFFGNYRHTALLLGVLGLLYGYLLSLLKEQDYALMYGSVGLFCLLGFTMYVTRRINWYELSRFYRTSGETPDDPGTNQAW